MALITQRITGLNGPGQISTSGWSVQPSVGMQVLFVISGSSDLGASNYPVNAGFCATFDLTGGHMYQFYTGDLSSNQLLVIYGTP